MNGDGITDLFTSDSAAGTLSILFGNGDGSFRSRITSTLNVGAKSPGSDEIAIGDLNQDGVQDVVATNFNLNAATLYLGNTTKSTTIGRLNLFSQQSSLEALQTIESIRGYIGNEIGKLGATQSRFSSAVNTLATSKENFLASESRIRDADIAVESAEMIRMQIIQQTASAVLAQTKSEPSLILRLMGN